MLSWKPFVVELSKCHQKFNFTTRCNMTLDMSQHKKTWMVPELWWKKLKLTIICKWGERWCNINATFHRADAMKWNIASSHGALPQTSFAYYGVFQFFHHNSGTIYVILCCDMSNINLHLVVKWNFWWHLESCTTNHFWDSISFM